MPHLCIVFVCAYGLCECLVVYGCLYVCADVDGVCVCIYAASACMWVSVSVCLTVVYLCIDGWCVLWRVCLSNWFCVCLCVLHFAWLCDERGHRHAVELHEREDEWLSAQERGADLVGLLFDARRNAAVISDLFAQSDGIRARRREDWTSGGQSDCCLLLVLYCSYCQCLPLTMGRRKATASISR